jgi:hypothetical protein
MKLVLISVALLVLIGVASAEQTKTKINAFNVSFELNKTHDIVVDPGDNTNGSITIRTFDGALTATLIRYPQSHSVNSTWVQDGLVSLLNMGIPAEPQVIDNKSGVLIISTSKDTGRPIYGVLYYPDMKGGKATAFVSISSTLPFYATADLLRTIHIAVV